MNKQNNMKAAIDPQVPGAIGNNPTPKKVTIK